MPRVEIARRFIKAFRRLSPPIQKAAEKALVTLIERPESKGLNLEPLTGMKGFYSIRVNLNYRILLQRREDDDGEFFSAEDVDTHDIYARKG